MPAEFLLFTLVLIGMVVSTAYLALRRIEAEGLAVAERARHFHEADPVLRTPLRI